MTCDFSAITGALRLKIVTCRRHAPAPLHLGTALADTRVTFPVMKANDWCGDWARAVEVDREA